jgi:hypothetical protein
MIFVPEVVARVDLKEYETLARASRSEGAWPPFSADELRLRFERLKK